MNNHVLQSMSLTEAKTLGPKAIECWNNRFENDFEASEMINLIHQRMEKLVDMSFDSGTWKIMKHESGAVFPVIIPEGQRNFEGWEGLSMSASLTILKQLTSTNPFWREIYSDLGRAMAVENLEATPCLMI